MTGARPEAAADEELARALLAALRDALAASRDRGERAIGAVSTVTRADVRARARELGVLSVIAGRDPPGLEPGARAELLAARVQAAAAAARARAELGELLAALEAAGVRALAIKGPALAARAGLPRPGNDLDLLVLGARGVARAERALAQLGLRAPPGSPPLCDLVGERVLLGAGRLPVDLHATLVKPLLRPRGPRPGPRDVERLELAPGLVVPTLGAPWTLALAVVHLHHDGLSLRRLVDLAALLGRLAPVDLEAGHALARRLGLAGVLRWGARLAGDWLGAPVPRAWSARPATLLQALLLPGLSRPALWTGARPSWLDGRAPDGDAAALRRTVLHLALADDALRVLPDRLLRLAFPPASYARWRGQGPARALGLVGRALSAARALR